MSATVLTGVVGPARSGAERRSGRTAAPSAAVLTFFVITLDAVLVNVALPAVRRDLGGGIAGLQWVVDGYTLMFAAQLLSAGARTSLLIAAGAALAAAAALLLRTATTTTTSTKDVS